jgi:anti-sigma factor RsiW
MQCDEIQQDLLAFLDGTLPPDRRAAVERHLASCQACSKEAAAMQDVGDRLSRGLKQWVDEGVCPPDLKDRIELSLRPMHKRQPWYRAWPAYVGAVAAAAVLVVLLGSQMDLSHQVASIPLVGTLAAQLFYPSADMQVDDVSTKRPADVLISTEHDGLKLEVYRVLSTAEDLRVQDV